MAQEGSEGSVVNSSLTANLWELHGDNSLSSWQLPWQHYPPTHHNSNSSCDEDISNSFTSDDSSCRLLETASRQLHDPSSSNEPSLDNRCLWSQVILGTRSRNGELHNNQDIGENFLEAPKNMSTEMFEPACDYLKKMENCWEFTSNIERQLNGFNVSNFVSNWSIAPPFEDASRQIPPPQTGDMPISPTNQYQDHNLDHNKRNLSDFPPNSAFFPSYEYNLKEERLHHEFEASEIPYSTPINSNKYNYVMPDMPWLTSTRNLSDISFNSYLSKPLMDLAACKPSFKGSNIQGGKKQGHFTARGNGRGSGNSIEAKKKRCEDASETPFKKPKNETSTVSSAKVQGPKVKLGDRITALQQIVSPFGKVTDTASVLQEAIGYIKFLQEQVQLLSNPYLKSNANKDPWALLERKDKAKGKLDLRSRGLCLVPISCTPQVYRENTGSDYWTPTYRGCLYR
ncbi:hypothetical protein GIB67_006270 [Kingdonia uniflora]|uniref:BHLH domain-containing protein n=1 Tax=Kingdonia uniflora TaxID=39325 RepID=A0A7J7P610_9MAGN|nr:hypothetical protein GIB67_006270 [Kingdonia uniflora]